MCGPSPEQEAAASGQLSFSQLLQGNYGQRYDLQSKALSNLNNILTPIAQAGPDQGIGSRELTALNTQAGEQVGANYAKAAQSLNTGLAARGGGNEYLPTGGAATLRAQLASA